MARYWTGRKMKMERTQDDGDESAAEPTCLEVPVDAEYTLAERAKSLEGSDREVDVA